MNHDESNENPTEEWPKNVLVRQTMEAASADLSEDYDMETDGGDTLMNEIGESMDTIEIWSWKEIPRGYEPVLDDPAEIESWEEYLRSQERR